MDAGSPGTGSVGALLAGQAAELGDRPFLVFDSDERQLELTYAEMLAAARATAARLAAVGARRDSRILLDLENCPEFVALLFGAALLGAEIVPTNPNATADDLGYVLAHSGAELYVGPAARRATLHAALAAAGLGDGPRVLDRDEVPLDAAGGAAFAAEDPTEPDAPPNPHLAVLYTSGTTSRPKGVRITHANYLRVGRVVADHLALDADDRWLVVLPLFHANAQYYCLMSALTAGASVALTGRFSASGWGGQARRHGATVASLFAAPIRMILASPPSLADADNSLRTVIFAQRVDERQVEEFESRFGCSLLQLYGMTETVAPPLMNPLDGERRNATVGLPTGAEVSLRDPDGAPAEAGELWVRGTPGVSLMSGYLDDEGATGAALADGWLRTGDILRRDADGWYSFEDRAKDMIKSAGENIAAAEVERIVDTHPEVFESAVIGIPDPIRDEVPAAFVVTRAGAALTPTQLGDWCRERMVKFKVPGKIVFVDELPRTSVGKVRKEPLRERLRPDAEESPRTG